MTLLIAMAVAGLTLVVLGEMLLALLEREHRAQQIQRQITSGEYDEQRSLELERWNR